MIFGVLRFFSLIFLRFLILMKGALLKQFFCGFCCALNCIFFVIFLLLQLSMLKSGSVCVVESLKKEIDILWDKLSVNEQHREVFMISHSDCHPKTIQSASSPPSFTTTHIIIYLGYLRIWEIISSTARI